MMTQNVARWGRVSAVVSGVLLAVGTLLRYGGLPLWGQIVSFSGGIVIVFALMALYMAQSERSGRLGFVGFVLITAGTVLGQTISLLWIATFAGVGEAHAVVMFTWGRFPVLHLAILGAWLGAILFGSATLRAGVFPRWTGLFWIVGGILNLLAEYVPPLLMLWPVGMVLVALALMAMAWSLWPARQQLAMGA